MTNTQLRRALRFRQPTRILTAAVALGMGFGLAACGDNDNDNDNDPTPPGSLVDVGAANASLSTLMTAVEAAGLTSTLQGEGPFTVFAPNDAAFAQIPEAELNGLLANPDALSDILLFHVVPGRLLAADVISQSTLTTAGGGTLSVAVDGETVTINGSTVMTTDLLADNGVLHIIDSVLLPDDGEAPGTIAEIVSGDDRFETLLTAVSAAGLADTLGSAGPFTVFAPTDEAFDALPDGTVAGLLEDTEALSNVLLYHVVAGDNPASAVVAATSFTTVQGAEISIRVEGERVFVNDAQVILTDITASNGVIHVIDAVLLPPEAPAEESIVDIAVGDDRFDTLVTALTAAELVETLQGEGPFTVFAPTDDAFDALPEGALDALVNDVPELTAVLLYHVVAGNIPAAEVVNRSWVDTVQGARASVRVEDGDVFIDDAQVVITDIEASNGVIHVIDAVITPPPSIAEIATNDGRFDTLVTALGAANLADTLTHDGPFTVFAPTDDAFAALPDGTLDSLLADPMGALRDVLLYHVVEGRVRAETVVTLDGATTLQGADVDISTAMGGGVMVNGANVVITDIEAGNGIIHVIDAVITPPASN